MKKRNVFLFALLLIGLFFLSFTINPITTTKAQSLTLKNLRTITQRKFHAVCGVRMNGIARCHARVVTDNADTPLGTSTPLSFSYGPSQFHTAYNLPCTPGGNTNSPCATPANYGGQTIAIVNAYHDPNIENDLNTYSNYYGLPLCTKANGCLTIVNENGGTLLPSITNSGWSLETSLDVEIAHMVCQTCKILLIEANSDYLFDLATGVNTAVSLGATEISNSYGGSEWPGETSYDTYYNHPGIAVIASSGDNGYGTEFPAASPNVVAAGGTTLQLNTDNTYASETVWNGTGSGCSLYEQANIWQKNLSNWNQTNCGGQRAIADIAADADPNTGAAVYDSIPYSGATGWYQVGGTSLASPLIAGIYALAGGITANTNASSVAYGNSPGTDFHDILTGNNGSCGTIMCNATTGYDGPSGLGSPNGYAGFTTNTPTPTPTLTLTPTPTTASGSPTPTPTPTVIITPTPTPTPTGQTFIFGYPTIGQYTDSFDQNYIDGSRFKMGTVKGTLQSISVYVASIDNPPHNQYQVAIYTDNNGKPGTLLAKSATGTLTANSWNTLSVSAPLAANTNYWLLYNTNATSNSLNDLKFTTTSTFMGAYSSNSMAFGTWPKTFASTRDTYEYSIYATYTAH